MASLDALFESYSKFMVKRGRYLLAVWVVLIIVLLPYAATLNHIISYSINVPSSDKESQTAENLVSTDFKGYLEPNITAYLVLEGRNVLSPTYYQRFLQLNSTLYSELGPDGLNGTTSIYGFEYALLLGFINATARALNLTEQAVNSTATGLNALSQNLANQSRAIQQLSHNITTLASTMWNLTRAVEGVAQASHSLEQNLTALNKGLYTLQTRVAEIVAQVDNLTSKINQTNHQLYTLREQANQSLQLVYGLPQLYSEIWLKIAAFTHYTQPAPIVDQEANRTLYSVANSSLVNQSKLYYDLFYQAWFKLTQSQSTQTIAQNIYNYVDQAVGEAVPEFAAAAGLAGGQAEFLETLSSYFNVTDFESATMLDNFTVYYATLNLTAEQAEFVKACFDLGPNPTQQQLQDLALYYATLNLTQEQAEFVEQAFYGVQKEGLRSFVTSYFEEQLNTTNPNITSQLEKLNTSLAQLVAYAYNLGSPPNQSLLENYTVQIVSSTIPSKLAAILQSHFNLTPQKFVEQILSLGYPPTNTTLESYIVSLFSNTVTVKPNTTAFLQEVYALGPTPTKQASITLAVNTTVAALTATQRQNITQSFNLSPYTYFEEVASLGYPPNPEALENLTITLFQSYLESDKTSLAQNITQNYNVSLQAFLYKIYNAGQPLTKQGLKSLAESFTYNLIVGEEPDQPLLEYNQPAVNRTIVQLANNTQSHPTIARELMMQYSIYDLPVRPTSGVLYQFVNTGLNTTVVMLTFRSPPNDTTLAQFENIAASYNTSTFRVYYTSSQIIGNGLRKVVTKSELYSVPFGLAAAILITAIFFMSPVAAFIPILVFGVGALVGFGLIHLYLGYYEHTTLSFISPVIILILALGLVTDYSVLILNRYRQELKKGEREALAKSTRWAGEAVFTSGLTVILSYVVLSAAHIPLFSDVGAANALIVVSILASALTFLPALLAVAGKRVFWPAKNFEYRPSILSKATRRAMSRPKTILAILLAVTVVAALVASTLPVNIDFLALTPAGPGKTGLDQISQNYGGSVLIPTYVVVQLPAKLSTNSNNFNTTEMNVLANLTQTMRESRGVIAVYGPITPYNYTIPYTQLATYRPAVRAQYASAILNYVSPDNRTVYFKVVFAGDPFGNTVLGEAVQLRQTIHRVVPPGYTVYVGGASLDAQAALSYVFAVLPKIVVILVSAIYVVLLLQLRSAFTPLRLIATVLSGIAWTLLLGWIIFYRIGGTSVFVFAPLFLVTTMLGVGVDYDIFMMTRVREEARKGLSDEEAILRTAETTAGVVTTLGLILSAVFFGLTLTQIELVQQIGLSLGIAILLDTFVVWLIYVPAIMVLAKRLNWWPSDPRREPIRENPP